MKRILQLSLSFSILGLLFGIFYREFTKFTGFEEETVLSVLHTHTFILAVIVPLLLSLLASHLKQNLETLKSAFWTYYLGYGITITAMVIRGISEVQAWKLSSAQEHSISGLAWIGHILLSIGLIRLFLKLIAASKQK